jgi:5'-nucleotidase
MAAASYPPAPTAAPVVVQPVSYDATSAVPAQTAISGSTYTVKKGDTLFGIARAKYGDGKQWKRIVSANPGVSPQTLKIGQTITLP